MKKFIALSIIGTSLIFGACQSDSKPAPKPVTKKTEQVKPKAQPTLVDQQEQSKIDKGLIEKYVADNKLDAKSTPSGIYYIMEKDGKGTAPTIADKVEVHYRGTLLDGSEFDSSYKRNKTATFPLRGVIKGWQEGIPLIKPGGKCKLIIPSGLAYGPRARPTIPANSVLIFDVELMKVVK